jgi:hypothetical protein
VSKLGGAGELAEVLSADDVRAYLLHLLDDDASWPVVNQTQKDPQTLGPEPAFLAQNGTV